MGQLLRFSTVGAINTVVGLLSIWAAMYFLRLEPVAANLLGYTVGLLLSFVLNRAWTFADQGSLPRTMLRWLALAGVSYLGNLLVVLVASRVAGVDPYLAQPLGIAAYTIMMFSGSRALVFREPRP
jgi:putative flippase GtrA